MKKVVLIIVLCALYTAPALADMYISVADGQWGTTNGGEFLITVVEGPIGIYDPTDQFKTFCIETDEFLNYGGKYYVTIDTVAWQGGTGGNEPDPLSPQSAYLYSLWLNGTDGVNTIVYNDDTANAIQKAIWYFEEEIVGLPTEDYDDFVTLANIAVADGDIWGNTIGNIRVMNLWNNVNHTGNAQDLLVRVPVPGAILLGILGLGVAGIKLRKYT